MSPTSTSLKRLEFVDLSNGGDLDEDVSIIKPFALLPAVKEIKCYGLMEGGNQHDDFLDCYMRSGTSNVTHLTIEDSSDIGKSLSTLLEGFNALKSFKMLCSSTFLESISDPFLIRLALQCNAAHSLEFLTYLSRDSDPPGFIGSMRKFAVLKHLDIDYDLLVDPSDSNGGYSIADILPPSIDEIQVHGRDTPEMGWLRDFIRQMINAKPGKLPILQTLKPCIEWKRKEGPDQEEKKVWYRKASNAMKAGMLGISDMIEKSRKCGLVLVL